MLVRIVNPGEHYDRIHTWDRLPEALGAEHVARLRIDANRGNPHEDEIWRLVDKAPHPNGYTKESYIVLLERRGKYCCVTQDAYVTIRYEGRNKL